MTAARRVKGGPYARVIETGTHGHGREGILADFDVLNTQCRSPAHEGKR